MSATIYVVLLGVLRPLARFVQVIQYIDMVNPDSPYSGFSTVSGGVYPFLPAEGFEQDDAAGHGTHTAGSAAGATLNTPAETLTCRSTETLGCVGACLDNDAVSSTDDLITTSLRESVDLDRLCSIFLNCEDEPLCLGDEPSETLTENGGMAQGAKLAIFDAFFDVFGLTDLIGNFVWEPCLDAGCKIHSNSLGADTECTVSANDLLYDEFVYEVRRTVVLKPLLVRNRHAAVCELFMCDSSLFELICCVCVRVCRVCACSLLGRGAPDLLRLRSTIPRVPYEASCARGFFPGPFTLYL